MFTGIVEEVGRISALASLENGLRLDVAAQRVLETLGQGSSISVDGVCQTVVALGARTFSVVAIGTTLSRTNFSTYREGTRVNLERPLALGAELGGHLVQGHVDAVGTVTGLSRDGEHVLLDVHMPEVVAGVTVLHGSIAINGVSLTVNALPGPDIAQVALIPYTWEHTNLSDLSPGDPVNLEGDMIGKFVVNFMKRFGPDGVRELEGRASAD